MSTDQDPSDQAAAPLFSISKAHPDAVETAAVLAVLGAALAPVEPRRNTDRPLAGGWSSYYRTVRPMVPPGPGAWANSNRLN